ncbi:OLC1v1006332C1 [Oldenlandia corymbosa var. corymbosa]|uniref:OLC1v1006332C1 n=1 Tax=Oldenlandia corymbosa var. corymbosa TaxID=529605 RepID=A0AAV1DJR2_OLDCO|nr:OLC1v1006332C1 [Oldenlandia corymbosa var. corymbosa]
MVITNISTFVKKEELELPPDFQIKTDVFVDDDDVVMDEFIDGLSVDLGCYHEDRIPEGKQMMSYWDFLNLPYTEDGNGNYCQESLGMCFQEAAGGGAIIKTEPGCKFWEDEEEEEAEDDEEDGKKMRLNLSLNYQHVQDAWSDRTLWADDSISYPTTSSSSVIEGVAPLTVIEEDRKRREASVLRYKEKRQARLFSKKIRYQVRKLNADNRPRLKGRFVKRDG